MEFLELKRNSSRGRKKNPSISAELQNLTPGLRFTVGKSVFSSSLNRAFCPNATAFFVFCFPEQSKQTLPTSSYKQYIGNSDWGEPTGWGCKIVEMLQVEKDVQYIRIYNI